MKQLEVLASIDALRSRVTPARREGRVIGLVPTMGALHPGHLSLVEQARESCDLVVATIFVNPTQFGPQEDFSQYPRTLEQDLQQLSGLADVVFTPDPATMYPDGFSTYVNPPSVAARWEGACRPDHFRGVCTVVLKLLLQALPDQAFFGAKDYQQAQVIRHVVRDLDVPVEIIVCPTVREADGLAMSSRNRYLSPVERQQARSLSLGLEAAAARVAAGETRPVIVADRVRTAMAEAGIDRVDYAAVVDVDSLEPLETIREAAQLIVAAHVGSTRLIDNIRLLPPLALLAGAAGT